MVRRVLLPVLVTVALVLNSVAQAAAAAAGAGGTAEAATPYTVAYTLTIAGKNQADISIKVTGAPGSSTDLNGDWMFSMFPAVGTVTVTDGGGQALAFAWTGQEQRTLRVQNGSATEFTVRYPYDALRTVGPQYQQVVFEPATVLFIADNVFLMPSVEPAQITARVIPPEGTKVFASLPEDPEENDQFVATKDLWGDLRYDFGKAYFTGGKPLFVLDHRTAWGDLYRYIWFDRDAASQMWLPSYGDTPWEEAEAYMAMTERLAKYEREQVMGPLPPHVVLFTDSRRTESQDKSVMSNTDFFHYMQIWPRDSEGEVAHHLMHAYTFHFRDQSKMLLEAGGFRNFLKEGLPSYVELSAPAALSGDDRTVGKVFEFWALEQRGRPFGIQQNLDFHVKYNQSTMRVYLLDRYIQRVTGGEKDVTDFIRAMWDAVKDRQAPAEFTEAEALGAFASVVGPANQDYIRQVDALTDFAAADFAPLLPAFKEYVRWMADGWFGGNQLLFLAYLDIAAANGGDWPHYATFPHQIPFKLKEAMSPFWQYLQGRTSADGSDGGAYTQADVLAALNASTGQDHGGFFEFWSAQGFTLDPDSLRSVGSWNPDASSEGERMPLAFETKGSLETEHNLAGVPQRAMAVLDSPARGNAIDIQVTLTNPEQVPPMEEALSAVSGDNVTPISSERFEYRGATYVRAFFRVTTVDPERRRFPFTLTLTAASSYPSFRVLSVERVEDRDLGALYFLPSVAAVDFAPAVDAATRQVTLPGASLKGAQFVVTDTDTGSSAGGSSTLKAVPGETVQLKGNGPQISIDLVDSYGFLRGRKSVSMAPAAEPPIQPGPQPNGEIRVTLDGRLLTFDVPPANVNDRVLVPLRAIAETLGAIVGWDGATQRVTMTRGSHGVGLAVGEQQAMLDGQTIALDVAPLLRDDRTLVPVRFISQSLGATVNWDEGSRTVIITSGQ